MAEQLNADLHVEMNADEVRSWGDAVGKDADRIEEFIRWCDKHDEYPTRMGVSGVFEIWSEIRFGIEE